METRMKENVVQAYFEECSTDMYVHNRRHTLATQYNDCAKITLPPLVGRLANKVHWIGALLGWTKQAHWLRGHWFANRCSNYYMISLCNTGFRWYTYWGSRWKCLAMFVLCGRPAKKTLHLSIRQVKSPYIWCHPWSCVEDALLFVYIK